MKPLLQFTSTEQQVKELRKIKSFIGITKRGFSDLMKVPVPTFNRFYSGETLMKPIHMQLLGLYMLLMETQPDLFDELIPDDAKDLRKNRD